MLANIRKAQEQDQLQTFEFFLSNQGMVNYYEARIAPLDEDEVILVLRNMSPLKAIQNDLREQNTKLDQKNRLLQKYIESNLQLENFAYIASHDLREPLRTIRTFAQYLNRDMGQALNERNRAHLDFVIGAANRMNQLIEDLLKYSTVNSDPMTNEPIELPELLTVVLQELQSIITEHKATIKLVNIPALIYGSPARIQQLFQNLISNAVKFRRPDLPPRITIEGEENPDYWQFSVRDNGIGIDPEFHRHIFIIFKRLHTIDTYEGTGIGLALVKRIVNQHGGDIWVNSEVGKGTTFTFTILK
jgi:light-regulated signal transduction histidine kinase (bacteriophytochrome)